jgi:hypothetical protein
MTRRPPIADWPARDRAHWNIGVEPRGLFGDGGAGADWSDGSRFKTGRGYAAWLSWLAAHDWLDTNLEPAERVTQERVAAYVAELQAKRAPYTVLCRVQELHDALRAIAPEGNWGWLAQLYRTLRSKVRPVRDKLFRLKPIDELAALGERLMDEAESAPEWSARRRAVGYRDGFLITLLSYRPVRLKNLAMMRLGRHLVKAGGSWRIVFAADETNPASPTRRCCRRRLRRDSTGTSTRIDPCSCGASRRTAGRTLRRSIRISTRSGFRKSGLSSSTARSGAGSSSTPETLLAAVWVHICFATPLRPRLRSTTQSTLAMLPWLSAMPDTGQRKSITIMREASKPRVGMR